MAAGPRGPDCLLLVPVQPEGPAFPWVRGRQLAGAEDARAIGVQRLVSDHLINPPARLERGVELQGRR